MKRALATGGAAGLVLGLFILGLLALFRRTARDPEEMKRITSLRCLAMIPYMPVKARRSQKRQSISVLDARTPHGYRGEHAVPAAAACCGRWSRRGRRCLW